MPHATHQKQPTPTRESVWFVVVLVAPINGTAITYDNIGNPNKTLNAAGQWVNLQWNGRQLVKATMPNGTYETYTYDADGLRTSRKQYNASNTLTKTCTYFWNEGRLVTQRILLPSGFYEDDWYFYDESGSPYGFNFTNSNNESGIRYFVRNLQGDIIESGSSTSFGASHKYDAWGAVTETVLGSSTNAANFQYGYIFGYRGYQYDKETGLYYCQSRYYNSRIGRFLSADEIEIPQIFVGDLFSSSLYQYANNNPIMNTDPSGLCPSNKQLTYGFKCSPEHALFLPRTTFTSKNVAKMSGAKFSYTTTTTYYWRTLYSKLIKNKVAEVILCRSSNSYTYNKKTYSTLLDLYMAFISNAKVSTKKQFDAMSEIDVLARIIYAEDTRSYDGQRAVALCIKNRKKKGGDFISKTYGNNYKGVCLRSWAFEPAMTIPDNVKLPTGNKWTHAKELAAKLMLGQTIATPSGYVGQLYFYESPGKSVFRTTNGKDEYKMDGTWRKIKSKKTIGSNVFFDLA